MDFSAILQIAGDYIRQNPSLAIIAPLVVWIGAHFVDALVMGRNRYRHL